MSAPIAKPPSSTLTRLEPPAARAERLQSVAALSVTRPYARITAGCSTDVGFATHISARPRLLRRSDGSKLMLKAPQKHSRIGFGRGTVGWMQRGVPSPNRAIQASVLFALSLRCKVVSYGLSVGMSQGLAAIASSRYLAGRSRDQLLVGSQRGPGLVPVLSYKCHPTQLGVVNVRRTLFGGTRREQITAPGWSFPEGSTASTGGPGGYPLTVCVLTDGRRLLGASTEGGQSIGFNERALAQMSEMAQLVPLPQFPPMSYNHPETGEQVWPTT